MAEGIVIGNLTIPVIKGDKGDKGNAGEIVSISLVLLSPSSTAYAINNGSTTQAQIELGIPKGLSVSTTNINASGELVFTFNDNSTVNVGQVVGKGISEVTVTEDFDFVVTYTDGTSVTACNLEEEILGAINDILEDYYTKTEIDEMGFITKEVNNLTNYYKKDETYTKQEVDNKVASVYKYKGTVATYADLPSSNLTIGDVYNVESDGSNYAWNGTAWDKLGGDIDLSGYQEKIDNSHKLNADLVDDTNSTNKFTSTSEKSSWNAKYDKPSGGIPSTDLSSDVQTSLGKADTAVQDVSGKEDKTNKTSTIDENSTNTQYPNAKAVYDELVLRDEEISDLKTKNEMLINDHVPITAKNTEIQLTGTGDLPMEFVPYGNISQETREGYNLIKNNNVNGIIVNANNISGEGSYLALADVEAETDYTISLKKSRISGVTISNSTLYKVARIEFYNNSTFLSQIEGDTTTFSSGSRALLNIFTTPTNCNNVKISLFNNNGDSNYNTLVEEVMLVKGTYTAETIPEYETYGASPSIDYESPVKVVDGEYGILIKNSDDTQSQTQTIDTSPNPLYGENDCYKYLTSEQATALGLNTGAGWYVYNEWAKVILNGGFVSGGHPNIFYTTAITDYATSDNIPYSNYYNGITNVAGADSLNTENNNTIAFINGNTNIRFYIKDTRFETINASQLNDWLSTNNLTVIYKLATPTYTKITNTDLIASLEALKDMQSYYDVTNISQTHSDGQADMIINAKALKSLKAMQSEIDELKQAILNS